MKDYLPIVYAVLTAVCWGTYGPVLAESRTFLKSPFKPYVAIGIAYLVWGIGGWLIGMLYKKDSFSFAGSGVMWGLAAGTLGAWGALIPFVGPHFNFAYTPDRAWTWTAVRGWLEVLPGAVTVVGGLPFVGLGTVAVQFQFVATYATDDYNKKVIITLPDPFANADPIHFRHHKVQNSRRGVSRFNQV